VGAASSIGFSSSLDASVADVAAGFLYSFDFNNDGDFIDPGDVLNSTSPTATYTFGAAGTFNVRGRITDKDGGFSEYSAALVVNPIGTTLTLPALADAFVRDGSYAGNNYGTSATLDVKKDATSNYRESHLSFDLSSIDWITNARLRLWGKLSDAVSGGINVAAYDVTDPAWVETSISYTTRPLATGSAIATANVPDKTARWIEWDLTSYLIARKSAGATRVAIVLKSLASGALVSFSSRNVSSYQPQLQLVTTAAPQGIKLSTTNVNVPEGASQSIGIRLAAAPTSDVVVNIARASGDADLSAGSAQITFTSSNWNVEQQVNIFAAEDADSANGSAVFVVSSAGLTDQTFTANEMDNDPAPVVVTLAPIADTFVRGGVNAAKNYGTQTTLEIKKDALDNLRETYLKFDLGALSSISNAKLRLYGKLSDAVASGITLNLYDAADTSWSETGITYATRPPSNAPVISSLNVIGTSVKWYEIDLTAWLQNQKSSGKTLVTLALKSQTTGALVSFNSLNASTNAPQLVIQT
jgi:hypothetical protein